jgi:hypothetical protein
MLIRKLTLTAFASFVTVAGSMALVATPVLADQDDYGYYHHHDRDDPRRDDEQRRSWNEGRYDSDGTWYERGYRGDDGRGDGDDHRHHRRDRYDRDRDRGYDDYDPHR